MVDSSLIKDEIDKLEILAVDIEKNMKKLLDGSIVLEREYSLGSKYYLFKDFSGDLWDLQRDTIKNFEIWYSMSLKFIQQFVPEKVKEFTFYYKSNEVGVDQIQELLQFNKMPQSLPINKKMILRNFIHKFDRQRHILLTIPGIEKIKELSIRDLIYATFIDREIDEAIHLYEKSHYRAAGAIAGIALEQHLRLLCDKYDLNYEKKDRIEPLVQKLYKNDKIDITEMKSIQHLANIRDKCDHPSDITASKVKELIEGIKKIL